MEAPPRRGSRRPPQRVYWVRRAGVLAGLALVIALLVWLVSGIVRLATPSSTGTPAPTVSLSETPSPTAPDSTQATALPTPATTTDQPTTPSPTPAPTECAPAQLSLTVTAPGRVKVGETAQLTVTVTNSGSDTCVFTFDSRFRLRIVSGTDEIWSTADCDQWAPTGAKGLAPGAAATWQMTWDRHRSQKPCKVVPTTLGSGTYVANAQLTGATTAQVAFLLVP